MKKIFSFTLVLGAVALIITGCNPKTTSENTKNNSENIIQQENTNKETYMQDKNISGTTYQINTEESKITWYAQKILVRTNDHHGTVNIKSGSITIENGKLINGEATINMTTIADEDLSGGDKEGLEKHIRSEDFFDVEKYPEARIIFKNAELIESDNLYIITADLTIKGNTNEITFPAQVELNTNSLKAETTFSIDRTLWDVRYGSGKFFKSLGDNVIDDEIKFEITLKAEAK